MGTGMLTAIGLMSGTSFDGIDVALIRTDGDAVVEHTGCNYSHTYDEEFRQKIKDVIAGKADAKALEKELTVMHADAVNALLNKYGFSKGQIDVIGFHGQTICHKPHEGITVQIGDGRLLAELTGINVVNDFRSNDVKHGGQGAPLVPVYHLALFNKAQLPVAVVNIGGVANVTYIDKNEILAFDTGPGNALMDDLVLEHTGKPFDDKGQAASAGKVNKKVLDQLLSDEFFKRLVPKSLDRNHFKANFYPDIALDNALATLLEFTARTIIMSEAYFPKPVNAWFITGGGRRNTKLMDRLSELAKVPVKSVEGLNFDGDFMEAEAFAYLAVRSLNGLPITFPKTTGVKQEKPGGVFCPA